MKKYKYYPFYFLFILGFFIIGQRYNFIVHGMPVGEHSWSEIWKKLPYFTICSTIMAFVSNQIVNQINEKQKADIIKAEKRLEAKGKYHSSPNTHECRVCGCYSKDFPWGEDGKNPSYQICPCCGVQFGKEDLTLESIKEYRDKWRSKGGEWFAKNEKPSGWDIEQQMKHIPDEFK